MKKIKKVLCVVLSLFTLLVLVHPIGVSAKEKEYEKIIYGENEVTYVYVVSKEEMQFLEREFLLGYNTSGISTFAIGDIPKKTTYSYGQFTKGSVTSIAGVLLGLAFPGFGAVLSIAGILIGSNGSMIYYTSIYTSERKSGILYVTQEWRFYSDSARTKYITNYRINRQYTNDGMD